MITTCIVIALAAAVCAVTISRSRLFAALRTCASRWELGWALVMCPYCLCHWLVLIGCATYRPRLVHGMYAVDWLVTALATIGLAAAFAAVLLRAFTFTNWQQDP